MSTRPAVEVAPGVFVMTSERYTTTSTIVRLDDEVLLVDPAWSVAELETIVEWLHAQHAHVTSGFATHAHHDHMLWHPEFGDAPRWTTSKSAALAVEWRAELMEQLGDEFPAEWPNPLDGLTALTTNHIPEPFGTDHLDETIELVEHDGHAPGHAAVWLPERGVLLAGDMLSDVELPLPFFPDDLPAYLDALDRLAPAVGKSSMLVPGHGHPTDDPMARLDADRRYLDDVIHGRSADDPRRALNGMGEAHAKIIEIAAALRNGTAG
ncbi:MAG: MBL fold metallo-hydrolase [Ilumatobacteraceae bacterium]